MTGALVHWFVVTASTMGLFGVLRLLEVRFGENLTASRHLGLAEQAPRLAVFFVIFGLALVGLPGTLSFCSQDLLIHGTLASHPLTGLLLPIAIAMNAVSIFRLFTRLFLGKRRTGFTVIADALPRERWILTVAVLFVVLGGLFPNAIVALGPMGRLDVEGRSVWHGPPGLVCSLWVPALRSTQAWRLVQHGLGFASREAAGGDAPQKTHRRHAHVGEADFLKRFRVLVGVEDVEDG
jgi:formate hydrogenlyase subunit 3/multisubunit Na+/H+ antiporter MnhD subunit